MKWKPVQRWLETHAAYLVLAAVFLCVCAALVLNWTSCADWADHHPNVAAWVQAVGTILALAIAIFIPLRIRKSEQAEASSARNAYKGILLEALESLYRPTADLTAIHEFANVNEQNIGPVNDADQIGLGIIDAFGAMKNAIAVIDELAEIKKLDTFGAIRAMFDLRRAIRDLLPEIEREANILYAHRTIGTVSVSIAKLSGPVADLRELVSKALASLRSSEH